jgi:hypothetical protein
LENIDIFCGHLECFADIWDMYFMTVWYILCSFGTFFPILVSCTKKNLATLVPTPPLHPVSNVCLQRQLPRGRLPALGFVRAEEGSRRRRQEASPGGRFVNNHFSRKSLGQIFVLKF